MDKFDAHYPYDDKTGGYDWLPGLPAMRRDQLLEIMNDVEVEHTQIAEKGGHWLEHVSASEFMVERLRLLKMTPPVIGNTPELEAALEIASASDTLGSKEFAEYAYARGYRCWDSEIERVDMVKETSRVWDLADGLSPSVILEWHKHLLRNIKQGNEQPARTVSTTEALLLEEERALISTIEDITKGRIVITYAETGPGTEDTGMLFSGPRVATILLCGVAQSSPNKPGSNKVAAHLLSHLLLEQRASTHYGVLLYPQDCRPRRELIGTGYAAPEINVDLGANCLASPVPDADRLTPMGQMLITALFGLGVPKTFVRLLLMLRKAKKSPVIAQLLKPVRAMRSRQKVRRGQLVVTEHHRVFYIDEHGTRHEVLNREVWDAYALAIAWNVPVAQEVATNVPDKRLETFHEGDALIEPQDVLVSGICRRPVVRPDSQQLTRV